MRKRLYIAASLWALLILALCAIPGRDLPHVHWLEMLQFDKWVHAGMFFILFFLYSKAAGATASHKRIVFAACVIYGALLEWLQDAVFTERSFDIYDEIANATGAFLGWVFYHNFDRLFSKIFPVRT